MYIDIYYLLSLQTASRVNILRVRVRGDTLH